MNRLIQRQFKLHFPPSYRSFSIFNSEHREGFYDFFRKQKILLRGTMVKQRTAVIPLPFPLKRYQGNRYLFNYSLSNLAGHASFLALAYSYLESDFISLRLYAIYGISMSIVFQYYRQVPLWIPIRWNTLFLLINAIMIILLLVEENDALHITPEEVAILRNVFSNHGHMKATDFRQLMSKATKRQIKKGERLVAQGVENNHIHLVHGGMFSVRRDNKITASIVKHQFVGEMSFLSWEVSIGSQLNEANDRKEQYNMWNSFSIDSQSFRLPWSIFDDESIVLEDLDKNIAPKQSPVPVDKPSSLSSSSGKKPKSKTKGFLPKGQLGHADVVCIDDCEVYSWSFVELYDILVSNPNVGRVFEKTIAADLNHKLVGTWNQEPKLRYREILASILIDSEITDNKRKLLEKYRQENNISIQDHRQMIEEFGWSTDDFETGLKGGPSKKVLKGYESEVEALLLNKAEISDGDKALLRASRKQRDISGEVHVRFLRKYGWTIDDYEVGSRSITPSSTSSKHSNATIDTNPPPSSASTSRRGYYWRMFITPLFDSTSSDGPSNTGS